MMWQLHLSTTNYVMMARIGFITFCVRFRANQSALVGLGLSEMEKDWTENVNLFNHKGCQGLSFRRYDYSVRNKCGFMIISYAIQRKPNAVGIKISGPKNKMYECRLETHTRIPKCLRAYVLRNQNNTTSAFSKWINIHKTKSCLSYSY